MRIGETTVERKKFHAAEAPDCQYKKADGSHCKNAGTSVTGDGHYVCGNHLNVMVDRAEQRTADLVRYETYQKAAFGGLVMSWTDERLRERRAATRAVPEGATDERRITVRAEHAAVVAEIKRRGL